MNALSKKSEKTKKLKFHYGVKQRHWVGNGFYVHGLLRPTDELIKHISPFILADYASPKIFSKTDQRRGVGEHPHRGFETVTLAYKGEVEHHDSSGGGGLIGEGDVQWMTAGGGIVHQEYHSKNFSAKGGLFEMVQLWVNLPKKHKMTVPKYQAIKNEQIPQLTIGNQTTLRVIAGEIHGKKGPTSTFTAINMFDLQSKGTENIMVPLRADTNTILLVLHGSIEIENQTFDEKNVLVFGRDGSELNFKVSAGFKGLVLNGEPIDEPVVAHGPFVMNSEQEIMEAITDYRKGKMGTLVNYP